MAKKDTIKDVSRDEIYAMGPENTLRPEGFLAVVNAGSLQRIASSLEGIDDTLSAILTHLRVY